MSSIIDDDLSPSTSQASISRSRGLQNVESGNAIFSEGHQANVILPNNNNALHQVEKLTTHSLYILIVYSLVSLLQNVCYNVFGPLAVTLKSAYNLTQTSISVLSFWYSVIYVLTVFPFIWLVETKGLRVAFVVSSAWLAFGSYVRTMHLDWKFDPVFFHVGQIFNGIAAPITFFGCATVSAAWFPLHQQTLATAISSSMANVGVALSFGLPFATRSLAGPGNFDEDINVQRVGIRRLMYLLAGLCAMLLYVAIIFFPSKPKPPESQRLRSVLDGDRPPITPITMNRASSTVDRAQFSTSIRLTLTNGNVMLMAMFYSVLFAVQSGYFGLFTIALQDSFNEREAGVIGLFTVSVGAIICVGTGVLTTRENWLPRRKYKLFMVIVCVAGAVMQLAFALACNKSTKAYLPIGGTAMAVLCILGSSLVTCIQPLCWAVAEDVLDGVSEAMSTGILTALNQLFCFVFQAVCAIDSLGYQWINFANPAIILVSLPLLLAFKPRPRRIHSLATSRDGLVNSGSHMARD